MKIFYTVLLILLSGNFSIINSQPIPSEPGSFEFVGNRTITFVDPDRNNRNIPSFVYYPATSEGTNTQILTGQSFPVISFGHGFTLNPNLYASIFRHLASWGYIVIAPNTETGFSPSHLNFALDLSFVLRDVKKRNSLNGDFFFDTADTINLGVFGHSMGGGCSFLAGSLDPDIKAISSMAAANTNPSSIAVMNQINVPVQLLSGQRDSIASYWTQQIPHYNNANPFKQIMNLVGANHNFFVSVAGIHDLFDNPALITRPEQQRITRYYVTAFFNVFLKNDSSYIDYLYGSTAQADTSIIMMYELPGPTSIGNTEYIPREFKLFQNYPNPFNPVTTISFSIPQQEEVTLKIFDINGREVTSLINRVMQMGSYKISFNASNLPSGVYFIKFNAGDFYDTKRAVLLK